MALTLIGSNDEGLSCNNPSQYNYSNMVSMIEGDRQVISVQIFRWRDEDVRHVDQLLAISVVAHTSSLFYTYIIMF